MKNGIKSGVESTHEERLPSIGELYRQQRPEMKAAETKEEAYDAIEPLVGLAGIYENIPLYEDLPVGGGILPKRIATLTPLSPREVEDAIVEAGQEFAELANEDNEPEVRDIKK